MGQTCHGGLNMGKITCLSIPKGLGSVLEKCVVDPFWTLFFLSKTAHFQGILGAKTRRHGLKMGSKHLFEHPKWPRNKLMVYPISHFFGT